MAFRRSPFANWWEFNGTDAALRLDGTGTDAAIFDPSSQDDDFTVAGSFNPDTVPVQNRALFAKYNVNGVDKRSWIAYQDGPDFKFAVSKDGTSGGTTEIVTAAVLTAGVQSFFCARYGYVADGTSEMDLDVDGTTASSSTAVGPVYSTTDADVQIGDYDAATSGFFEGDIFWLAYWNRKLTDTEAADMRTGAVHPMALSPDAMIFFRREPETGLVYEMEVGGYGFTMEGSPVLGGGQEINAVITLAARKKWCETDASTVAHAALSYFKIGEGGWINDNGFKVTRAPDPSLTDLDCILDSSRPIGLQRYPAAQRYSFQKSFTGGDVSLELAKTVLAECALLTTEGNGGSGMFWEIGVFDAAGTMIVYATFTEGEYKDSGLTLQRDVRIYRE